MHNISNQPIATTSISVAAIEEYISLASENCKRHLANIIVHANERDLSSGIKYVSAKVSEGEAEIVIEDLHTVCVDCFNTFTLKNSSFSLFHKTLQIKTTNVIGQKITIEITSL